MSSYKLTYFNGRGRGELIRFVFAAAGVPYEDVRIEKEQWPGIKPTTPFGQVPVLEFEGIKLFQSNSIARYLAKKFGLAGKTDLEHVYCDMAVDCIEDLNYAMLKVHFEQDEKRKQELKTKLVEEQIPTFMTNFEKFLESNNGGKGFLVGDTLTWADLAFLNLTSWLAMSHQEAALDKFEKLKALLERIKSQPKVAEWLAKRPATEF